MQIKWFDEKIISSLLNEADSLLQSFWEKEDQVPPWLSSFTMKELNAHHTNLEEERIMKHTIWGCLTFDLLVSKHIQIHPTIHKMANLTSEQSNENVLCSGSKNGMWLYKYLNMWESFVFVQRMKKGETVKCRLE